MGRPMQPIVLCSYEVDAEPIFDAMNPSQRAAHLGTDFELSCPDWEREMLDGAIPASQMLADRLIAAVYLGMRVQSFALGAGADDLNLVFWHWSNRRPSRVVVIDDEGRLLKNSS